MEFKNDNISEASSSETNIPESLSIATSNFISRKFIIDPDSN